MGLMWTHPMWLWGVPAAVLGPVLLHWLSRWRGRVAAFPPLWLLREAVSRGGGWWRISEFAVLVLRGLAWVCLVLVLAGPAWRGGRGDVGGGTVAAAAGGEAGVLFVGLLDASASMAAPSAASAATGRSRFDAAKRRLIRDLRRLEPGRDTAAVLRLAASPRWVWPQPTGRVQALADAVRRQSVGQTAPDLAAAGEMVQAIAAAEAERGGKAGQSDRAVQLVLYSDAQHSDAAAATSWPGALTARRFGEAVGNAGVSRLRVEPGEPVLGQAATVSVEATWHGPAGRERLVSARLIGGEDTGVAQDAQTLRLRADEPATLAFAWRAPRPGWQRLRVVLSPEGPDALAADNAVEGWVRVRERRSVWLATRSQGGSESQGDARATPRYVVAALSAGKIERSTAVRRVHPDALASMQGGADVWVLCEAGRVAWSELRKHLASGGGVVWFVDGPEAGLAGEPDVTADSLPWWGPDAGMAWRSDRVRWDQAAWSHPLLAVFQGESRAGLLEVGFTRRPEVAGLPVRSGAEAVLSYPDGSVAVAAGPAAVTGSGGAGRVVVCYADVHPDRSDLVRQAVWPALVHEWVHWADGDGGDRGLRAVHPGEPLLLSVAADLAGEVGEVPWRLQGPEGVSKPIAAMPGGGLVDAGRPRVVGSRWVVGGVGSERVLAGRYVSLEPGERDTYDVAETGSQGGAATRSRAGARLADGPTDAIRRLSAGRDAVVLWPWLLLCAAGWLVLEQAWVGWRGVGGRGGGR